MKRWGITHCLAFALLGACGGNSDDKASEQSQGDAGTEMQGSDDAGPGMPMQGGTSGDAKLEADGLAKLKECQLEPPASADPAEAKVEDDYDRCAVKCVLEVDCADLKELFCLDIPSASNAAALCLSRCPEAPADGFACKDGTKIAHAGLCDGFDDCDDGGDEVGCGEFNCADGETVTPKDITCDGFDDCTDGSDEKDCPNVCG